MPDDNDLPLQDTPQSTEAANDASSRSISTGAAKRIGKLRRRTHGSQLSGHSLFGSNGFCVRLFVIAFSTFFFSGLTLLHTILPSKGG